MNMASKKDVDGKKQSNKPTTTKRNNCGSKMKKSGGANALTITSTPRSSTTRKPRNPNNALTRPSTAIQQRNATSARFPSDRLSTPTQIVAMPRQPSAIPASARPTIAASDNQLVNNNDKPPLPPGRGTEFFFEFECDKDEMTKNMCKDGSDLEATSSRLQQIIQQIIDELLAAPDALPPLNILLTQILVSFVVDVIQNVLSNPTHRQEFDPNDKNINNLFKMASNIVLTSLVTTGSAPTAATIVIRVLVKRSLMEQKKAPSLPAMGKNLTIETFKQSKKILKKFNAFKPRMIEIMKNNDQQPDNLLTMQGIVGSRPKTRNGGRKSRLGN